MVDAFAGLTDAPPQPELPEPFSYGAMDTFWVNNEAKQRWINTVNEMKTTPSYDPRDTSITVMIDSLADGPGNWEMGTLYGDGTLIRHRDGREMFAWVWDNEGSSGIDDPTSPGTPNTDGGGGDPGGGGPSGWVPGQPIPFADNHSTPLDEHGDSAALTALQMMVQWKQQAGDQWLATREHAVVFLKNSDGTVRIGVMTHGPAQGGYAPLDFSGREGFNLKGWMHNHPSGQPIPSGPDRDGFYAQFLWTRTHAGIDVANQMRFYLVIETGLNTYEIRSWDGNNIGDSSYTGQVVGTYTG